MIKNENNIKQYIKVNKFFLYQYIFLEYIFEKTRQIKRKKYNYKPLINMATCKLRTCQISNAV